MIAISTGSACTSASVEPSYVLRALGMSEARANASIRLGLGRFTMALYITLDSGMPIARALRLSLLATGNAAFTHQTDTVTQAVKNGEPLTEALTRTGLFQLKIVPGLSRSTLDQSAARTVWIRVVR